MEEKEREAEKEFKGWLDRHEVPYWYIHQDVETFSPALRKYMARRPDFMILIPNLGFILTDVEYKPPLRKYDDFPIDKKETEQYVNLQKYFNFQVWYVFSHSHYNTWNWIPVQKVLERGEKRFTKDDEKREYLTIPIKETIQLSGNDGMDVLLSKASSELKVGQLLENL